jgi:hypothetical protein
MLESNTQEPDEAAEPDVEQTNPAKRLHAIIAVALTQSTGVAALEAWATTFGIDAAAANPNPHDVTDRLRLMNDEIAILRRLMRKTQFSADLYEPALQNVLYLLSVSNLAAGWNAYVGLVSAADMLALRWCSEAIESESGLTHAELQSLLDAINAFKESVESEDLPESVREFVLQQIDLMIRGIHQYPIIGRRAAREAVRRAAGEFMDMEESVSSAAPPGYWGNLAKLWKTLLGSVEGSEKMVKAMTGIAEAVPKLVNAASTAVHLIP